MARLNVSRIDNDGFVKPREYIKHSVRTFRQQQKTQMISQQPRQQFQPEQEQQQIKRGQWQYSSSGDDSEGRAPDNKALYDKLAALE